MNSNAEDRERSQKQNEALMKIRFQNYNPRTEDLKKCCEESIDPMEMLREITEDHDELIKTTNRKFGDPTLDLENLVPKKGNWDIKRSLAPKLERLERRTQRALIRMAQEKARANKSLVTPNMPNMSSDEEDE